jgi:hypothetical protein
MTARHSKITAATAKLLGFPIGARVYVKPDGTRFTDRLGTVREYGDGRPGIIGVQLDGLGLALNFNIDELEPR